MFSWPFYYGKETVQVLNVVRKPTWVSKEIKEVTQEALNED